MSTNGLTHGITVKDKVGYALGDMGGLLTFGLISSFLNMFYTDVLHIPLAQITILMLIAKRHNDHTLQGQGIALARVTSLALQRE